MSDTPSFQSALVVRRGDSFGPKSIKFYRAQLDGNGKSTGQPDLDQPIDLRTFGDTWRSDIRRTTNGGRLGTWTVAITDAEPHNELTLSMSRQDSAELEAGVAYWDVEVTDSTDSARGITALQGVINVVEDYTHD